MGIARHSTENLGPPFLLADEIVFVIPRGGRLPLGRHHFKLLFVLSGRVQHEIDSLEGRQDLGPGDILIAPVVKRHHYINPNQHEAASLQVMRIFFDSAHLAQHERRRVRRPETDLTDFLLHHFPRVAALRKAIDAEITELIESFRAETDRRLPGYRHRVRAICTSLIIAVARKLDGAGQPPPAPDHAPSTAAQIVAAAKEYILKHFDGPITLGDVAWHVRKGDEHLARVFKRKTGQSVFDYVRELRMHRAKTLLQDASLSLTEIAERCGYQSLSFFSRTFREHVGISPSRYRAHVTSTSSMTELASRPRR